MCVCAYVRACGGCVGMGAYEIKRYDPIKLRQLDCCQGGISNAVLSNKPSKCAVPWGKIPQNW